MEGIAWLGIYLIILWAFATVFGARAVGYFIVAVVWLVLSIVVLGFTGFVIYIYIHS